MTKYCTLFLVIVIISLLIIDLCPHSDDQLHIKCVSQIMIKVLACIVHPANLQLLKLGDRGRPQDGRY